MHPKCTDLVSLLLLLKLKGIPNQAPLEWIIFIVLCCRNYGGKLFPDLLEEMSKKKESFAQKTLKIVLVIVDGITVIYN
jgi:hypothetical protein